MNLDELRSVQSKERQKDSLQNLRPSFYQEVGEYIADLEDERDRVAEESDDPFSSPEVGRLTDEIETAKDVVEAVYERRMGKLVKQASLAAAGMPADDDGLTAEEADLFDDLVDRISSNKSRVLDVLEGVETEAPAGDGDTGPARGAAGSGSGPADAPRDAAGSTPTDSSPVPGTDPTAADPMADPGTAGDRDVAPANADDDDAPPVPPQEPPADADAGSTAGPGSAPEPGSGSGDSSGVTPADVMGGDGPDLGDETAGESPPVPDETPPDAPSAAPADTAPDDSEPDAMDDDTDIERVTVRITRDVGPILGVDDREYSLSTDDIVTLPEQNADPLLEQDAAEPLE